MMAVQQLTMVNDYSSIPAGSCLCVPVNLPPNQKPSLSRKDQLAHCVQLRGPGRGCLAYAAGAGGVAVADLEHGSHAPALAGGARRREWLDVPKDP